MAFTYILFIIRIILWHLKGENPHGQLVNFSSAILLLRVLPPKMPIRSATEKVITQQLKTEKPIAVFCLQVERALDQPETDNVNGRSTDSRWPRELYQ